MPARRRRDTTAVLRAMPLFVALLGAIAACIGASLQGLPLPGDVAGVFVSLGLGATWLNRATPLRGACFLLMLCAVVVGIVYGG